MADTCFLCFVASVSSTPGCVGTCAVCSVHVCAQHGERLPRHFLCADCVTAEAARRALADGPSPFSFAEEAPRTAAAGRGLFDHRLVDDMHHALKQFGTEPMAVALQVRERLRAEASGAPLGVLFERLSHDVRTIEPPSDPSRDRAEYAVSVLAAAYAAHGAWSLERSIFHVSGGPQMPALVILLSTMLMVQLESPFQLGY